MDYALNVGKAAEGLGAAAAGLAYVNNYPRVAYIAFDLANNRLAFLVCTRERMEGKWELETFPWAGEYKQTKFLKMKGDGFSLKIDGPWVSIGRRTYEFMRTSPERRQGRAESGPTG